MIRKKVHESVQSVIGKVKERTSRRVEEGKRTKTSRKRHRDDIRTVRETEKGRKLRVRDLGP